MHHAHHTHTALSPETLLAAKDLRVTKPRLELLHVLIEHEGALSQHELEQRLGPSADRVTVYRTLKTFLQAGILHAVPDEQFGSRYALCDTQGCASDGPHQHDHMHFKCTQCGDTLCLEDVRLPALPLPQGYQAEEITVLAKGICKDCGELN